MHLVLSADKTDVEQCLPHIKTLTEINRDQTLASSPTMLWPGWPALLFFFADKRVHASCRRCREPSGVHSVAEAPTVFLL